VSKTINPKKDPIITPQHAAMRCYSSVLFILIALLPRCVPNPGFHQVVDTGDGGFVITRVHTERISFEVYTQQIYLTKLNGDGEPVWDRRTVNKRGNAASFQLAQMFALQFLSKARLEFDSRGRFEPIRATF
jgi:hypothetical protein